MKTPVGSKDVLSAFKDTPCDVHFKADRLVKVDPKEISSGRGYHRILLKLSFLGPFESTPCSSCVSRKQARYFLLLRTASPGKLVCG